MRNALFSSSESGAKDFTLRGASITWRFSVFFIYS